MIGQRTHACDGGSVDKAKQSEVVLRILSAIVLAMTALVMTYAGVWPFTLLVVIAGVVTSWEWSRITCNSRKRFCFLALSATTIGAALLTATGWPEMAIMLIAAAAFAVVLLATRSADLTWLSPGAFLVGLPTIALVWLRQAPEYGWWSIFFIFAVVWATDSAAYFSGRLIGGAKLAPHISPNKTWSGFCGGLLAAIFVGTLFTMAPVPSAPLTLSVLAAVLSVVAQIGDLAESAIKRRFGTKDASSLIPGHGGLLDRIDGLLFAALAAAGLVLLLQSGPPGQGIFI